MRARKSAAVMGAILTGLGMTLALAQPASARPNCDVPNPPPICNPTDPPDDPPPTGHVPVLAFDGARQMPSRTGVQVWGWTADDDSPTTSLTVRITIDGGSATTVTANQSRPDVAAAYPKYGAAHGFELVLPVSPIGSHNICVTAVSVGGGADKTLCRQMDDIVEFVAYNISYDTAHAILTNTSLEQLDKVTNRNDTAVQQTTEISGSRTATDTVGWSDTTGIKITASTTFETGIPIIAEGKITVTVEGSATFTQNGSRQRAQTFSWRQPVVVPARSIVEATVTITHSTISVPYTLTGEFIYRSGARTAGSLGGTFVGGNSENLSVILKQYNLDGSPAAAPVAQSKATMLKVTPAR